MLLRIAAAAGRTRVQPGDSTADVLKHRLLVPTAKPCLPAPPPSRACPFPQGPRTHLRVVRPVYASPSIVRVDLKTSKAEAPRPSWPDIYFAARRSSPYHSREPFIMPPPPRVHGESLCSLGSHHIMR